MLNNRITHISYQQRKQIFKLVRKKRFKNYRTAHAFKISLDRSKGFYTYVSPYHIFSKKRFTFSPFKYMDYSQNRHDAQASKTFGSYGEMFWKYFILCVAIFDLYWFRRIFRRSISREKATLYDKRFLKNNIKSSYNYDLLWEYESWEYFDVNGVHKYTWWCFGHFTENFYGNVELIKRAQQLAEQNMYNFNDSWFYDHQLFDLKVFKVRFAIFDYLEFDVTTYQSWYRLSEDLNDLVGTQLFQTTIFPDSVELPIDWWFYIFS